MARQQPIPAKAEGRRADNAVIFPNGSENKLISQNRKGGLSGYGALFKWGTMKLPVSSISLETCAYRGSSGAHKSLFPVLNNNKKPTNSMIQTAIMRVLLTGDFEFIFCLKVIYIVMTLQSFGHFINFCIIQEMSLKSKTNLFLTL